MSVSMQKFIQFMKSTKGIIITAIVLFGTLFFAFTRNGGSDKYINQRKKILTEIGSILETQHYSPKIINDAFSKKVFKKYLEELDNDKTLFFQSDINALKKYETTIDDEIHGADIQFVPAVSAIYDKRINEVMLLYKKILAKPFNFTTNEYNLKNADSLNYSSNEAERDDRWRKKLKQYTLEIYADLIEQKEKNKADTSVQKPDSVLEKEAREKVLKVTNRMYDRIKAKYNEDERFNSFINVITNLMDPHTDYLPPIEKRAFDEMMSNKFYGIGAQLQEQDGIIKIASILSGGPAWKSGELMVNDIILKVAQGKETPVDVSGFDVTDAVKLIRGSKGTEVRLTIKKQDGTIKTLSLIRDEIVQDESSARSAIIKNGKDKIGYIWLQDFYADFERANGAHCSEDFAKEIGKLKAENVKGIILDLRFNGGGSLYEVVQMVGMLIGQGPVVQVRDKDGKSSVLSDRDNSVLYDGPFAVMVNEESASASEIFAAAIQDYKRGIIVGSSSTYGKGTVQRNIPLGRILDFTGRSENGAIKLTFQKFYRINGGSTQLKGVTPDVVIPDIYEYLKIREKDNDSALPWDEIAKSPYQYWQETDNLDEVIKKENNEIKKNTQFNLIKNNTEWLSKNMDKPISLNFTTFIQQQKKQRATVMQNNSLAKLTTDMDVEVMKLDKDKFYNNSDKSKGERYQDWLKRVKNDLYISSTAKIVSDMIATQVQTVAK